MVAIEGRKRQVNIVKVRADILSSIFLILVAIYGGFFILLWNFLLGLVSNPVGLEIVFTGDSKLFLQLFFFRSCNSPTQITFIYLTKSSLFIQLCHGINFLHLFVSFNHPGWKKNSIGQHFAIPVLFMDNIFGEPMLGPNKLNLAIEYFS